MIRKIPEETASYHFYNANPKGLRAADCVIRAISLATGTSWEDTYTNLFKIALKLKRATSEKETYSEYLSQINWVKMPCPKKKGTINNRFTGVEFSKILTNNGLHFPVIANIGSHHVTCFKDGKVYDIWDCTDGSIGQVWVHRTCVEQYNKVMAHYCNS